MNDLEKAIVKGFISDNPIRMEISDRSTLRVNLNDLEEAVGCIGQFNHEQFLLIATAIAIDNECFLNPYGMDITIIVRHPRDIRLGTKIDVEKIFENIKTAQKKMYKFFAGTIARNILEELCLLNEEGLLAPAITELNKINNAIIAGD